MIRRGIEPWAELPRPGKVPMPAAPGYGPTASPSLAQASQEVTAFNPFCLESGRCTDVWLGGTGCAILRAMDTQPSFADRLATRIRRSRLDGLAILLLEGFRPLAPLVSQFAYMLEPFVGKGRDPLAEMGHLLETPSEIDSLIDRLTQREEGDPWTS